MLNNQIYALFVWFCCGKITQSDVVLPIRLN